MTYDEVIADAVRAVPMRYLLAEIRRNVERDRDRNRNRGVFYALLAAA